MPSLAHQILPGSCDSTLTFDQFRECPATDLEGFVAEEKFDGRRYLYQVRPNGAPHNFLTSRRVSKTTNEMVEKQDSDVSFRDNMFGPSDTVYDGEMLHPDGGTSHEAATAIANGFAVFRAFDLLRVRGQDIRSWPWHERRKKLVELSPGFPERMTLVPVSKNPGRLLEAVRAVDGEGIILKLPTASYGSGWIKVVGIEFADVVVTGYEMSKSEKYGPKNWIKGVKFGQWAIESPAVKELGNRIVRREFRKNVRWALIELGQTSGFTEAIREEISANQSRFLWQVMMLRFKGREASGAFRHPRFAGWHPDKNSFECVVNASFLKG